MSFLVSALLALAAVGTVLGAAFYFGLISTGGGVASASQTPRPNVSFVPGQPTPTPPPTLAPSASPSPTPAPTVQPTPGGTYIVQTGDALSLIGEKFGIPWQLIAEANNIQPPNYVITPGQTLIIPTIPQPSGGGQNYVIVAGDNITKIANKFGIDPTTLADFNNIVDWNSIQVGQIIQIPKDNNATPLPTPTG